MVIDDLDIVSVPLIPSETDAPLIVDADAPLPFSIPSQFLKSVARRDKKKINAGSAVNQGQFSKCGLLNILWESRGKEPVEYFQRFLASECLDHGLMVTTCDSIVKRYYPGPDNKVSQQAAKNVGASLGRASTLGPPQGSALRSFRLFRPQLNHGPTSRSSRHGMTLNTSSLYPKGGQGRIPQGAIRVCYLCRFAVIK